MMDSSTAAGSKRPLEASPPPEAVAARVREDVVWALTRPYRGRKVLSPASVGLVRDVGADAYASLLCAQLCRLVEYGHGVAEARARVGLLLRARPLDESTAAAVLSKLHDTLVVDGVAVDFAGVSASSLVA